jgi:hypothetical protein
MLGNVCLRPVGTRGGCGAGWGPCACPGGSRIGLGSVRPTGRIPTRTSTRSPHPPHCAPCPYRTRDAPSPMRLSKIQRGPIMACNKLIRPAEQPARPIMSFNTFIQACGGFPTGRYIGSGRDTSGPTGCRVRSHHSGYFVTVHNRLLPMAG